MKYKKIVVKIGTSVIAKAGGGLDRDAIIGIARQVSFLLDKNIKVILVSSGAIGAGLDILNSRTIPSSLSGLQATASIGQSELMHIYSEAFKKRNYFVGQILLTQDDFDHRRRYLNIKYTMEALLGKRAVPIVNENDTVATEEIKCGDNDRLSSLVADLSEADLLIILTDVDGLYDKEGKVVSTVEGITGQIRGLVGKKCLPFTKGGMATKIEAAERVTRAGIDCLVANGRRENIILELVKGAGTGTHFKALAVKAKAKKRWIAYSSKVKGSILVDDGAKTILINKHKSLLSSGIIGKDGNFKAGDVISIMGSEKKEFARGLTNYSSKEIERIKGLKTGAIEAALGYKDHDEVVHRD
ncbi:MAG: glutamate 5-kinase, partial [Candidatus Omnitrophota bacterium]